MHAVARYRFLSSVQINRLIDGSAQKILRRLQLLFQHRFLDRPVAQVAQLAHIGEFENKPIIYGLGKEGLTFLAETGLNVAERLEWTTKSSRVAAHFLAHTIETADVMIGFELACRDSGTIRLLDHYELLPYFPKETRDDDVPFRARATVTLKPATPRNKADTIEIGVVPDRLLTLVLPDRSRANFALELDRGTMDIKSKQLRGKSSFRRKLLGYWHLWEEDIHTARWGFKAFRVLTVTTSEKRIENMIAAQKEIVGDHGSKVFLFTTPERLAQENMLTDPVWISGKGQPTALFEAPASSPSPKN